MPSACNGQSILQINGNLMRETLQVCQCISISNNNKNALELEPTPFCRTTHGDRLKATYVYSYTYVRTHTYIPITLLCKCWKPAVQWFVVTSFAPSLLWQFYCLLFFFKYFSDSQKYHQQALTHALCPKHRQIHQQVANRSTAPPLLQSWAAKCRARSIAQMEFLRLPRYIHPFKNRGQIHFYLITMMKIFVCSDAD